MTNSWEGVIFKLEMARFYIGEMNQDLHPAVEEQWFDYNQLRRTSPPTNRWAPKFFYHLDAFLAATRSVDFVITSTFGKDKKLKEWIATLSTSEQKKREEFHSKYQGKAGPFRKYFLTHLRDVSVHRSGTPFSEVATIGLYGVVYRGGPTKQIPTYEQPQLSTPADPNHPPRKWRDPQITAIQPRPDEFVFHETLPNGENCDHPLFPSCEDYLRSANRLVDDARKLGVQVHTTPVTPPPLHKM